MCRVIQKLPLLHRDPSKDLDGARASHRGNPFVGFEDCPLHFVKYWTWSIREKVDEAIKIIEDDSGHRRVNLLTEEKSTIVMPQDLEDTKDIIRNKTFLMFNRRMRDQRVLFITLFGRDFINKNYISLISNIVMMQQIFISLKIE